MRRALKWLLPALILAEVALVWFDVLDLRDAILIVIGLEALLLFVGSYQILGAIRRYRRNRSSGLDVWAALEDGLTVMLPRTAARFMISEPRLFYCLVKWVFRRTKLREGEFSYHKRSALDMFVLLIVLVSPVEILVVEVLLLAFLPLLWLRLLVLLLEIYGFFWFLGFYASRIALPHSLGEDGISLHHGTFAEGFIPYSVIESAERKRMKAPGSGDGLIIENRDAFFTIAGHTDITLALSGPRRLHGFLRPTAPVDTVHLAVDAPEKFVEELKGRVGPSPTENKEVSKTQQNHELHFPVPSIGSNAGTGGI